MKITTWMRVVASMWFSGVVQACTFHRTITFFIRSRTIFVKTGQCFLLNGCIFLGSIVFLDHVVVPCVAWLLQLELLTLPSGTSAGHNATQGLMGGGLRPKGEAELLWGRLALAPPGFSLDVDAGAGGDSLGSAHYPPTVLAWLLNALLIGVYNVLWLYPAYVISFVVNCIWYKEIAQLAFQVQQQQLTERHAATKGKGREPSSSNSSSSRPSILGGDGAHHGGARSGASGEDGQGPMVGGDMAAAALRTQAIRDNGRRVAPTSAMKLSRLLNAIGEEVYRIVLSAVFFTQVFVVGLIPYVGRVSSVLLLSWLYGFYSFDYSWSLLGWSLHKRLRCFESNWAFFAGFGFPCTLVTLGFPTFTSAAIMAALFPQFVLMAALADPERTSREVLQRAGLRPTGEDSIGCLPIFYLANYQRYPCDNPRSKF
eukprot:jgi/Mesvir1/17691/Mv07871-RA.1